MELQTAQLVYDTLKDAPAFTAVMGTKFFPIRADEGTAIPFAVYRVDEDETKSKDGAKSFFATVVGVFPAQDYLACLAWKDAVHNILEQAEAVFLPRAGSTEYDDETDWIYGIVVFEIMNH